MATTHSKTAIALQGGGALGAYSFGALKYIYESEPNLRLSSVSGVSIGAFTAAIVASHPDNPIGHLQSFWKDLTVFHSNLLPAQLKRFFAYFGNPSFYLPRQDYYDWPVWTSFYELSPIKDTLAKYVSKLLGRRLIRQYAAFPTAQSDQRRRRSGYARHRHQSFPKSRRNAKKYAQRLGSHDRNPILKQDPKGCRIGAKDQ